MGLIDGAPDIADPELGRLRVCVGRSEPGLVRVSGREELLCAGPRQPGVVSNEEKAEQRGRWIVLMNHVLERSNGFLKL